MRYPVITAIIVAATLTSGCSTRPRAYAPQLAAAPADETAFQQSLDMCHELTASSGGKAIGSKVAGGAGAAAVGGATAGGAAWGTAAAAGAATIVALPVLGLVWGISRGERAKKEKRIQRATTECLQAEGYTVAGWTRIKPVKPDRRSSLEVAQHETATTPVPGAESAGALAPE